MRNRNWVPWVSVMIWYHKLGHHLDHSRSCFLLTPPAVSWKSSSRLPVPLFCSHGLLRRAKACTDNSLFPCRDPAFPSVTIQMASPGFQGNTNLRSSQLKINIAGYFLSPTQISLQAKHYASTKSCDVTHSLQLFWLHWMPYKHLLFLEIAWDVLPRDIIIYSCYEMEKEKALILCHVISLVESCMQYTVEAWEKKTNLLRD